MKEIKTTEEHLIALRRARVSELLAKGYSQADIAKVCVTSEPTISRDVQYLREQAIANMDEYVNSLPLEHKKVRETVDIVLRRCFEMLDGKDSENTLEIMKLILSANELRSSLLADVTAIDKAKKYTESLEVQIAKLRKGQAKPANYEVVSSIELAPGGKKGTVRSSTVQKKKSTEAKFTPVV
jgi:transposase